MYMFEVNLDGVKFAGRTWKEFVDFLQLVSEVLNLNPKRRKLIVYVQNLAYEFQFMRRWLQWVKVFAIDERTPVYALCELGILVCSLSINISEQKKCEAELAGKTEEN